RTLRPRGGSGCHGGALPGNAAKVNLSRSGRSARSARRRTMPGRLVSPAARSAGFATSGHIDHPGAASVRVGDGPSRAAYPLLLKINIHNCDYRTFAGIENQGLRDSPDSGRGRPLFSMTTGGG